MSKDLRLLKNIEKLGLAFRKQFLAELDSEKLESDWFEALKFFFGGSFARGRSDVLSLGFRAFTIERLEYAFTRKNSDNSFVSVREQTGEFDSALKLIQSFKKKYRLGKKTASKHGSFNNEVAERNGIIRLLTTPKKVTYLARGASYEKQIHLANDDDLIMVLGTLKFISGLKDGNIYTHLRSVIQNDGVRSANNELKKLHAVKDKIASLVIRDIGLLNPGLIKDDFAFAFPVDTWVRQLARKIGFELTKETPDEDIKKCFIGKCVEAELDPLLVAAGLWYLGTHSVEILLEHYLDEYGLGVMLSKPSRTLAMNESVRYVKLVVWSDEDQCFVGQCPGVIGPCCHGDDEAEVYAELCGIVDEWIETLKHDGNPLPPPTAGRNVAQKIA